MLTNAHWSFCDHHVQSFIHNYYPHSFSMTVLHLTSDEVHKSSLVTTSDRLLRLKNRVADYCNNVLDNPSFQQLHRDFDHLCEKLSDDFKDLESVVNVAVLRLLVETFMETHEPLDRLIKAAMISPAESLEAEKENRKNSAANKPAGRNLCDVDFEAYVDDFCTHAETLGKEHKMERENWSVIGVHYRLI